MSSAIFESALLVEDEIHLADALEIALRKLKIPARKATTIAKAQELLAQEGNQFDFVLLDRNLPDGDGLSLCSLLRENGFNGTILVLTAVGEIGDRVEGLNRGADDYLPKPFSWEELEARIRALARRKTAAPAPIASPKKGGRSWMLDEARLRIQGPRGWIELTPLEFKLAKELINAQGSIVTRDHLLKKVWGFTLLPKTRTVDHFLGRLRKHFEKDPEQPQHFLTVRGAGYRFEA
jgi:two-component system alkaline phosphatase synthesis response regulator PhoP